MTAQSASHAPDCRCRHCWGKQELINRSIAFPPALWEALQVMAAMHGRSAGEQMRLYIEEAMGKYGLSVADGELVLPTSTMPAPDAAALSHP